MRKYLVNLNRACLNDFENSSRTGILTIFDMHYDNIILQLGVFSKYLEQVIFPLKLSI